MRRVGGVVLDPELADAELLGQLVGADQRGPAGAERRVRMLDGQEIGVAPDRVRTGLDATLDLVDVLPGLGCVLDL
jgi:hypothetical protein